MTKTNRLPWRCTSRQQAKDKQDIYNSREWRDLRAAKLRSTDGLCEMCMAEGVNTTATCVHHKVPIETATSKVEMRRLALECGLAGLQSLCKTHHAKVHQQLGSNTRQVVAQRATARRDRWADGIVSKFLKQGDDGLQTEIHEGPVRQTNPNRTSEAQAQTDSEGDCGV